MKNHYYSHSGSSYFINRFKSTIMKRFTKSSVLASINAIMFFISIVGLTNNSFSQKIAKSDNVNSGDLTPEQILAQGGMEKHPEEGMFKSHDPGSIEIMSERTSHSKLFKNTDGTMSFRQSEEPLHYLTNNGIWLTYDDQMTSDQFYFKLKSTDKQIKIDKSTSQATLNFLTGAVKFGKNFGKRSV